MKACVVGLWHLGTVTAACLAAAGHEVIGLEFDDRVVADLAAAKPPIFEPGLADLLRTGLDARRLRFTTDAAAAVRGAEVVWIAYDTPVDADDQADVESVLQHVRSLFPHLSDGAVVLISSQLPVGTTRGIEREFAAQASGRRVSFAYSPENLRLGQAIAVFSHPDRVVVGVRTPEDREPIARLLAPITDRVEWMSPESAEMTKHAINAFLATSVAFVNEIAALCEQVGADATEVERGLKSEARIGPKAYLSPGGPFAGGTLARDVVFLSNLGNKYGLATHMLSSVKTSNDAHRGWARRRLVELLDGVSGKVIAVWGLTYKPGTNTLRRSNAVELCQWLVERGAVVRVHDPSAPQLPPDLRDITVASDPLAAVDGADALVVMTPWPAYKEVSADEVVSRMKGRLTLDANRFLGTTLGSHADVKYVSVGTVQAVHGTGASSRAPGISGQAAAERVRALEGRNAIITGANQGLGVAIAKAYVLAGASVMLCARDAARLSSACAEVAALARPGQLVVARACDVSSNDDVGSTVAFALEKFGRLHVLVNNAGIYGPMGLVEEVDWDEWVHALEVNLFGSVLMARAVLPHFCAHHYGKIVQLSGGGATTPMPRISAYAASKAAVVRFAETLASEARSFGVDVNAIAPGALNTRLLDQVLQAGPERVGEQFYARSLKQRDEGGAPPERAAALAVFLASAASDGISGKLVSAVWDPWESLGAHREDLARTDVYTLRRIVPADRGLDFH